MILYVEWVENNVLAAVAHRQYVFTLPKLLRPIFSRRQPWLGELCRIAARLLADAYTAAAPDARPGLILFVQTFGDPANYNPHRHVLAADRDLVVVDRAAPHANGGIVVARVDGELVLKKLYKRDGVIKLKAGNKAYRDIEFKKDGAELEIWGVVTHVVHSF